MMGRGSGGVAWVKVNPGRWNVKDTRQRPPPCDCFMTAVRILNIAILTDRGSPAATHSFSPFPTLSLSFFPLSAPQTWLMPFESRQQIWFLPWVLWAASCHAHKAKQLAPVCQARISMYYTIHTHIHTYTYNNRGWKIVSVTFSVSFFARTFLLSKQKARKYAWN